MFGSELVCIDVTEIVSSSTNVFPDLPPTSPPRSQHMLASIVKVSANKWDTHHGRSVTSTYLANGGTALARLVLFPPLAMAIVPARSSTHVMRNFAW